MKTPNVSVVMSVYNGSDYLRDAIDSILAQTYKDFEFIIIDDGSTDTSGEIIRSYEDSRIRVFEQENKGLVASLNRGITEAKGTYIARMDADDLSIADRLEKQVAMFGKNPELVLAGSSMQVMDETSTVLHTHHVLLGDSELKHELLVRSPFAHGSTMFKREAALAVGMYDNDFWPAEDYDLWLRLSAYGGFANIHEPLYVYRENSSGISIQNQQRQVQAANSVRRAAWRQKKALSAAITTDLDVKKYEKLEDGAARIQRIEDNLSTTVIKSIKTGDIPTALRLNKVKRILHGQTND